VAQVTSCCYQKDHTH